MAILDGSDIIIRDETLPPLTTKGAELTWQEMDNNLYYLTNALLLLLTTGNFVEPYEAGRTYKYISGTLIFCTYGGGLYKFVATTDQTGVTPGTNQFVWYEVTIGDLTHFHQVIWDPDVIAEITDEGNWTPDYVGSETNLTEGMYYLDTANKVKYEYLNGNLIRFMYNNISI